MATFRYELKAENGFYKQEDIDLFLNAIEEEAGEILNELESYTMNRKRNPTQIISAEALAGDLLVKLTKK